MAQAKPSAVASSKGDYVVTKLDDLINWARRVSTREPVCCVNIQNVLITFKCAELCKFHMFIRPAKNEAV